MYVERHYGCNGHMGEKYLFPMVEQVTAREESGVFSPEHAYVSPS